MKRIFALKSHYQKIKGFYKKYERWLMPVTLAVGFTADYITFVNIQINTALTILFIYWVICAVAIAFIHSYDAGKIPEKLRYIRLFTPLLVQFTFGGLLSNSFIFYWFSGSIWVSWPFILAFVAIMVSNDALREQFKRPTTQLSVYFFSTFSIFSVALPFTFSSLSPGLFLGAGAAALVFIVLYIVMLRRLTEKEKFKVPHLAISIFSIFIITNVFYFTNLIPPVPLAVRETGLYHNVQKTAAGYMLTGEKQSFWQKLIPGQTIHLRAGEKAYIFSAIFAPEKLTTKIVHEWQFYDEKQDDWVIKDKLSFTLMGDRKEGFRGYSLKTNLPEGSWRVYIKTTRGQTLGRIKFKVETPEKPLETEEAIK
ncbi:MAG: hypothetical protein COT92_01855 [Candidatus Doudnabacteria bacterium CG10_big_fil_rev_8_21_14_0_10_42_18]|uniref:DUF2914 domain-containing protein n=1 Tax=Candidatus Doudnabacteria bacterium CG10_big_fil_rev_8_21_14_0_10_42_18 TaxID=1974552 RepID=A0A2H0VB03_9BACT|nr:MAG: hypothetical protein COT92_01855 [Candidatus Doudnabacteria bacterium CG10_big_fil_rev_8_21_14_0_10_42_18]